MRSLTAGTSPLSRRRVVAKAYLIWNISSAPSDIFCRVSSRIGLGNGKLYTDYAVVSFSCKHSVLFTAINPPTKAENFINARTVMIQ